MEWGFKFGGRSRDAAGNVTTPSGVVGSFGGTFGTEGSGEWGAMSGAFATEKQ